MLKIKSYSRPLSALGLAILILMGLAWYFSSEQMPPDEPIPEAHIESPRLPVEKLYPHVIAEQSTLYTSLISLEVDPQTIHEVVSAAKPKMDLARVNSGIRFRLIHEGAKLTGIDFRFSAVEKLELRKAGGQWAARKVSEPVESKLISFKGLVSTSLWESAEQARMDPNLIVQLAEIFAWEVDFAREVRVNDRWRLNVEQKFVQGEPVGWGNILAAEYEKGGQTHTAVFFQSPEQPRGYYAADGTSLRRMFLKSPIPYGKVTSRFTRKRFHPILKISRPHLGVDFGAPTGTPVRAVGGGTVTLAGWNGGGGRTIKISHSSIYRTAYLHLSRFGAGIRSGSRVQQGQIIGYVGTSGLSTGPHLHFEFWSAGKVVDPLSEKFPSADPVPNRQMAQFRDLARQQLGRLPGWESVVPRVQALTSSSVSED